MQQVDLSVKRAFIKKILILIPLGSENLSALLSPVLGQYGLNVSELVYKILSDSIFFNKDITLRVFVYVFSNNTYTLEMAPVGLRHFIASYKKKPTHIQLLRVLFLYSFVSKSFSKFYYNYKNFKGFLSSINV